MGVILNQRIALRANQYVRQGRIAAVEGTDSRERSTTQAASDDGLSPGRVIDDDGEFDAEAATDEARSVLAGWRRDDVRTASERTRRLTLFGVVAVLALFVVPTGTTIGEYVTTAALWTLAPATVVVGSLSRVFKGAETPDEVLDGGGISYAIAMTALVVLSYGARRGQAGRTAWRFLFRSAPFSPDVGPGLGYVDEDDGRILTWGRRIAASAAVLIVADATWTLTADLRRGGSGADLLAGVGSLGGDLSTLEGVGLLVVAVVVGGLIGLSLAVRD